MSIYDIIGNADDTDYSRLTTAFLLLALLRKPGSSFGIPMGRGPFGMVDNCQGRQCRI